jgi:ATP/maltotriose-dependent transcriptional regulator MalT
MGEGSPLSAKSLPRLTPPLLSQEFIPRESLLERLSHPAPKNTFLIAPSGFGKTVLAAQFAARLNEPFFWYTINSGEATTESLHHLVHGLRSVNSEIGQWFEELDETKTDYFDIGKRLANEISQLSSPITIIFDRPDNFSSDIRVLIQAFADAALENVRTFSLRNKMPSESFIRTANLKTLEFITAADLRFNESEVEAMATTAGINYSDPKVRSEFRSVQGWPAGVTLLIDRLAPSGVTSKNRVLEDIVISNAVQSLSPDAREYLESLIFLDEITFPLAQEFNPKPISTSGDHPLIHMSQNGIFLEERSAGSFYMNSLIKSEILKQISADPEKLKAKSSRAVKIFEEAGHPVRAVEILVQVGDEELASKGYVYLSKIINKGDSELLAAITSQVARSINLGEIGRASCRERV